MEKFSLRSTENPTEASLTLNWDQPNNVITDGDVTAYNIHFKASGGRNDYRSVMTVNAPARSIHLTRESGLKKYTVEVRARNFHCQGEWSCISEYMCMCTVLDMTVKTKKKKKTGMILRETIDIRYSSLSVWYSLSEVKCIHSLLHLDPCWPYLLSLVFLWHPYRKNSFSLLGHNES